MCGDVAVQTDAEARRDQIVAALRQNIGVLSDAVDQLEVTPTDDVATAADLFALIGESACALGDAALTVAADLLVIAEAV